MHALVEAAEAQDARERQARSEEEEAPVGEESRPPTASDAVDEHRERRVAAVEKLWQKAIKAAREERDNPEMYCRPGTTEMYLNRNHMNET